MSGGHFGNYGYDYWKVAQFADELEEEILNNGKERNDTGYYGIDYYPKYSDEVIDYLKEQVTQLRKMSEIMRHVDYLYSGDHGEDSFMNRVQEVENKYNGNIVWQETGDGV